MGQLAATGVANAANLDAHAEQLVAVCAAASTTSTSASSPSTLSTTEAGTVDIDLTAPGELLYEVGSHLN
jgi:hypothetical protein